MRTNCATRLAYIFLYSYEAEFIVFALNREKTVGVSIKFHIQIHRFCFVHKQPRVWELPRPDVSRWTWDQRHDREQHFCFIPWFILSIRRDGQLHTSIYDKHDDFKIVRSWVAIFQSRPPMASLFRSLYNVRCARACSSYGINLSCTNNKETHVLAFNMQIPYQVECLVVFACWKQEQDLCVIVIFVQYLYIFQYVTQSSAFTRQNTMSFIILVLITIGIGRTCM